MPGLFERWTDTLPLQTLAPWRSAPVTEAGGRDSSNVKPQPTWRAYLGSKIVWRTIAAIIIVALLADFFHPTRTVLEKQGWVDSDHEEIQVEVQADCPSPSNQTIASPLDGTVDWSQYAYCQYVTDEDYLCNSLMIFESLTRLDAKADKVLLYPKNWASEGDSGIQRLLRKAADEYNVKLQPIHILRHDYDTDATWVESFSKLLAFNQTQYKRVLSLDSDATVLKAMDELFLLPSAPVAMPRAYWLDEEHTLSSQLLLVEPSEFEFDRIQKYMSNLTAGEFDMEIVNQLYGRDCFIIPHRKYDLLTGEFRAQKHRNYLGSDEEVWDAKQMLDEAKFLHFSDWPVPKPWLVQKNQVFREQMPKCTWKDGTQDCRTRDSWVWIYDDFRARRKVRLQETVVRKQA